MGRTLFLVFALGACRRPDPAPVPPPLSRDAARAAVEAPAPRCGPVFARDDAAPIAPGTDDAPREISAACNDETLAVVWRAGGEVGWAMHPLRDGSRWRTGRYELPGTFSGGAVWLDGATAWSAVVARDGALRLLRAPAGETPARLVPAQVAARLFARPAVLWVEGERALVALEARASGSERAVWLLAFGGGAPAWAVLGNGALATTAAGARALVARIAPEDTPPTLRGRWIDARAALRALTAGAVSLEATILGRERAVPLPHAGMEFMPRATAEGAVGLQAVIGAERGAAGLARFPPEGEATLGWFANIPSALGDAVVLGESLTLHTWDERYLPRRRSFRGEREVGDSIASPPAGNAFAALEAARTTRHLACNGAPWSITVRDGQLRAAREDCP